MSVFICDEDTLAVSDKFLTGFYGSHKVNIYIYIYIYIYICVCVCVYIYIYIYIYIHMFIYIYMFIKLYLFCSSFPDYHNNNDNKKKQSTNSSSNYPHPLPHGEAFCFVIFKTFRRYILWSTFDFRIFQQLASHRSRDELILFLFFDGRSKN